MKILFAHNTYQQTGGEDTVVDAEIALLRAYGHEVGIYRRHNNELNGISPTTAALSTLWSLKTTHEIGRVCDIFTPDIIHVHNSFPLISPSLYWIAARKNVPIIQTLHNFRFLCPQGMFLRDGMICEDCVGKVPWRAVTRKCYRKSAPQSAVLASMLVFHRTIGTYRDKVTRYIALNTFCRDKLIDGGLPSERLRIKPNFVESNVYPDWNARRGGLFVGRLAVEKGLLILFEAAKIADGKNITVIGNGPCSAMTAALFDERYLGFLPSDDIMPRMRSALYLIMPSISYESSPCTIIEAFSCGLPVIASRLGALCSIIQDGVTGILFNSGDATDLAAKIAWAESHPGEMLRMGQAARAEYEAKYTPQQNYRILMDIYGEAIAAVRERYVA